MQCESRGSIIDLLQSFGSNTTSALARSKKASNGLRSVGKILEKRIRHTSRRLRARLASENHKYDAKWQTGDLLVLSGSTWDMISASCLQQMIRRGVRLVTIVCDLIPVLYPHQFADKMAVQSFHDFLDVVVRDGALSLSISQSTHRDLLRFASERSLPTPQADVLYLGADVPTLHPSRPGVLPAGFEDRPFVLNVGTIQVRKNHHLLYQVWRRFAEEARDTDRKIPRLVIAGSRGWLTGDLLTQIENDPLVRDHIVILDSVNDDELCWLYRNCSFTVYPAIYEGWGLPIVESLSYGKPCIASNTSSMPEAGQGLALHLDPFDFRGWCDAISRWSDDPALLDQASLQIDEQYRHRSWDEFSHEFADRMAGMMNIARRTSAGRAA
jgi:glycosyltransferase involved in cell wall biosynthesis